MTHYTSTRKMFEDAGVPFTSHDIGDRSWITVQTSNFNGVAPGRGERIEFVFNKNGDLEQMFVDDPNVPEE